MPRITPSDEEKALYLLSGVVTVGGVQWVTLRNDTEIDDCRMCPHGDDGHDDCGEFLWAVRGFYVLHGVCHDGFIWTQLKPEPFSS